MEKLSIAATPEILQVAQRVVWHKSPEDALRHPYIFIAHVMNYGTLDDVVTVKQTLGLEAFRQTLEHAPAGIFRNRAWAYWNLVCGTYPPPPLPERQFPDTE